MMARWLWFAPLGLIVLAIALWGFRLGWIVATITETDVIEVYASIYVDRTPGARVTDCSAQPHRDPKVWVLVSCARPGAPRAEYPVDRLGRLIAIPEVAASPPAPET